VTTFLAGLLFASTLAAQAPDPARMQVIWEAFDDRMNTQTDIWFDDGEFPRVIQAVRVMYALYPNDYEIATNLGWMLENIELDEAAIEIYRDYARNNPKDPDATYPEAQYYYREKQYEKVPDLLEPAIKMDPKPHPNAFRTLAHSYERLGKLEDSRRVWQAMIKLHPDDEPAKNNLRRVEGKIKAGGGG